MGDPHIAVSFLPLLCCIITIVTTEYVWVSSSSSVSHSVGTGFFLLFFSLQVPTGIMETIKTPALEVESFPDQMVTTFHDELDYLLMTLAFRTRL